MEQEPELSVTITLSRHQVEEVLRAASLSRLPSVSSLIAAAVASTVPPSRDGARAAAANEEAEPPPAFDRRLSRSLLRGLSILTSFDASDRERGIVELARELGMSSSTAHRYAVTLLELGLLERSPSSRKYRLPRAARAARAAAGQAGELAPAGLGVATPARPRVPAAV